MDTIEELIKTLEVEIQQLEEEKKLLEEGGTFIFHGDITNSVIDGRFIGSKSQIDKKIQKKKEAIRALKELK